MMINKVVVCPICGEKTWLRIQDGGYLNTYPIRVNCMNCRALLRGMYIMADGIWPRGLTMYNAAVEECETNPHVSESKTVSDKEKVRSMRIVVTLYRDHGGAAVRLRLRHWWR